MKKILAISDLHCGSRAGLTPPEYQPKTTNNGLKAYAKIQKAMWNWYVSELQKIGPVDYLFVLGDCVDGSSKRAKGRDLIIAQREDQIEMAIKAIKEVQLNPGTSSDRAIRMVYGTPYHVEDAERAVARDLGASIKAADLVEIEGVKFHLKHFINTSKTNVANRANPFLRQIFANLVNQVMDLSDPADVFLRGHVHYCVSASMFQRGKHLMAISCPALATRGTEYGELICEGPTDHGILEIHVDSGKWEIIPHIVHLNAQKQRVEKI